MSLVCSFWAHPVQVVWRRLEDAWLSRRDIIVAAAAAAVRRF